MRVIRLFFFTLWRSLFFCCLFYPASTLAQIQVTGRALDRTTGDPLPSVVVVNLTGHMATSTDAAGGFKMPAVMGDKIFFSLVGYRKDTITVGMFNNNSLEVLMSSLDMRLPEVTIYGQRKAYGEDSAERYREYAHILEQSRANGFASPVDALYDVLSKRRKQVWHFQKIFKAYEEQKYLASRVTPEIVHRLTGLEGDSLSTFLNHYQIDYYFARNASDIALYLEIRRQVEAYRRNDYPFSLLRYIK